jgi:L-lactate dehydrogenase complex protein LldE
VSGVVQLFVTCLVDGFAPGVGVATVRLLEGAGFEVAFPFDQTCCGQPALNAGYRPQAIAMAEHTVAVLDATYGPIVVPSGSCADMLIHHAPQLLAEGPREAAARRVAGRTVELSRFLADSGVPASSAATTPPVAFHRSCHGLRGLGLEGVGEELLDRAGVERCELAGADECCGFGGLFSIEIAGGVLGDARHEAGRHRRVGGEGGGGGRRELSHAHRRRSSSSRFEHSYCAHRRDTRRGGAMSFRERAVLDIATPKAAANDAGARTLSAKREKASAEYSAMEEMRDRAREIRLHTLGSLDSYLGSLADAVEGRAVRCSSPKMPMRRTITSAGWRPITR